MSLFSCHLVQGGQSGEINLSALELIEINKKKLKKNVQLDLSGKRMVEIDTNFND